MTFRDPLSEETRTTRTYLLGLSMAGIVMVHAGLLPSRITALGIAFEKADRRLLLFLCGLVTAYFLVAFFLYAIVDFIRDLGAWSEARSPRGIFADEPQEPQESTGKRTNIGTTVVVFVLFFQYALPILIGAYSTTALLVMALV
jgi:hypothetical protein